MAEEFEEISHSGGKITFAMTDAEGQRSYGITIGTDRGGPAEWAAVYALPRGTPLHGSGWEASDSLGMPPSRSGVRPSDSRIG